MIAMYDSRTGKVTKRGQHHGTPRMWVVQVRAEGLGDVLTFHPIGKCRLSDLSGLIEQHMLSHIEQTKQVVGRMRWTATAR